MLKCWRGCHQVQSRTKKILRKTVESVEVYPYEEIDVQNSMTKFQITLPFACQTWLSPAKSGLCACSAVWNPLVQRIDLSHSGQNALATTRRPAVTVPAVISETGLYGIDPWKILTHCFISIFPQQRKLMGSSTPRCELVQKQVRFNEVPEKVPTVPEKLWEALVQVRFNRQGSREGSGEGLGCFGAKPCQVQQGSGEGLGSFDAEPGQVQQGSGEGSGEGLGGFDAEPGQVQQGSEEGSEEGLGGFGAEPGQVQQGSREGSGERSGEGSGRLWCRAGSSSTGFQRKFQRRFREALMQSQFRRRFRRRSGKLWRRAKSGSTGSGEGLGGFGAARRRSGRHWSRAMSGSTGFRRRFRRRPGRLWCRARSSSTGFRRRFRRRSVRLWCRARSGSTGFRRRFRKPWCKAKSGSTGSGEGAGKVPEKVLGIFGAGPGQVQQVQQRVSSAWLRSTLEEDL